MLQPSVKTMSLMICLLVMIVFMTLLERNTMGCMQIRKGPDKAGWMGLPQPILDSVKLFTKEPVSLISMNFLFFMASPVLAIFLTLTTWLCFPTSLGFMEINMSMVFLLCCLSATVFPSLLAGWAANSKYSLLGSMRAAAQTISYEISLSFILLSFMMMAASYEMPSLFNSNHWWLTLSFPLAVIWFASSLAETNRTPFDFAEGESELGSGFHTEYSGSHFALFSLAEYGSILFMSLMFVMLFMSPSEYSAVTPTKVTLIAFIFIWTRGTLPRMRYDKLMTLAWKTFLPISLNYLLFFMGIKMYLAIKLY